MSGTRTLLAPVEAALARHALADALAIEIRSHGDRYADVRLRGADRWPVMPSGRALLEELTSSPAVADLRIADDSCAIRFHDDVVAAAGERVAGGNGSETSARDALHGRAITVGFIGPNTCKALHVGHLRNIVLGDAVAATLTAAGATVVRESLVGDIGRSVCEALAGWELLGCDPAHGEKPDHFVERCYRRWHCGATGTASPDDPTHEEGGWAGDRADMLLARWHALDPDVRARWDAVRRSTLTGHSQTLARLAIVVDRLDFESAGVARAAELIAEGLERGILRRGRADQVVYDTGRADYATLALTRVDGFPTEQARLLAVYERIRSEIAEYVELAGDEWRPSQLPLDTLLLTLRPEAGRGRHTRLFHAMVNIGGTKVSSSGPTPPLIDEVLDELGAAREIGALSESSGVHPDSLVELLVRGYFLGQPASAPQRFHRAELLDERRNIGVTLARALTVSADGRTRAIDPTDRSDRLAILRSQSVSRMVASCATRLDTYPLVRFARAIATDALAAPTHPALSGALIGAVLQPLGYVARQ